MVMGTAAISGCRVRRWRVCVCPICHSGRILRSQNVLTNDSCYDCELREDDVHVDGVVRSIVEHQPQVDVLDRMLCLT